MRRVALWTPMLMSLSLSCQVPTSPTDESADPRVAAETIVRLGKEAQALARDALDDVASDEARAQPIIDEGESARRRGDKVGYISALRKLVIHNEQLVARLSDRHVKMRKHLGAIADITESSRSGFSPEQESLVLEFLTKGNTAVKTVADAIAQRRSGQQQLQTFISRMESQ